VNPEDIYRQVDHAWGTIGEQLMTMTLTVGDEMAGSPRRRYVSKIARELSPFLSGFLSDRTSEELIALCRYLRPRIDEVLPRATVRAAFDLLQERTTIWDLILAEE